MNSKPAFCERSACRQPLRDVAFKLVDTGKLYCSLCARKINEACNADLFTHWYLPQDGTPTEGQDDE